MDCTVVPEEELGLAHHAQLLVKRPELILHLLYHIPAISEYSNSLVVINKQAFFIFFTTQHHFARCFFTFYSKMKGKDIFTILTYWQVIHKYTIDKCCCVADFLLSPGQFVSCLDPDSELLLYADGNTCEAVEPHVQGWAPRSFPF